MVRDINRIWLSWQSHQQLHQHHRTKQTFFNTSREKGCNSEGYIYLRLQHVSYISRENLQKKR